VYSAVVAVLPPANVKIRFFAPEGRLPTVAIGDKVRVSCDGCEKDLTATVSFISNKAEYTPPVIYSMEERAKLVFLMEAKPDKPSAFRVGQPVSVSFKVAGAGM
jgi:HlyD family secretion protein